ncbi:MAG TPA: MBOAT family O-acyltransferase [Oculatellaceae cyanobacterium]
MIFSTYWFLIAAALFLPFYFLVRNANLRFTALILFCVIFHTHFAGPAGVIPIVVLGVFTYLAGISRHPTVCSLMMCLCVAALCFYKYTHFLVSDILAHVSPQLATLATQQTSHFLPAAPPLAVSFFVFEFVHYLFEIRKGEEPVTNVFEFAQFTLFFPSLVAGPIKRYREFIPSLHEGLKTANREDVMKGFYRVLGGFFKKSVIADNLTLYITAASPRFASLTLPERWLFVAAIALRIYFDFSGYTDMAIGFARMLGVRLPQNFNWPYLARSIQEFWQRWHISLSSWIRDYVYIPLGGSRHGLVRRVCNGLVAFVLCGLWHGAAWNFVLWGLYHGLGLAFCSSYRKMFGPVGELAGKAMDRVPAASWALTTAFVSVGWLLFFYPVSQAWDMTRLLFCKT